MIQINAHIQVKSHSGCNWEIVVKDNHNNINKKCTNAKEFFEYMNTLDKEYTKNTSIHWSIDENVKDECFEKIQNEISKYIKDINTK